MTAQSTGQYLITADTRRGNISLMKNPNDGLLHFTWTDRDTNSTEDDRMLFPDEAVWKKVKSGREGDRVFMLKLKSSNQVGTDAVEKLPIFLFTFLTLPMLSGTHVLDAR